MSRHSLVLALTLILVVARARAGEITIAVASNFTGTLERLASEFEGDESNPDRHKLLITSGSTGKFHAQIKAGAPFDLFLSADAERPMLLVKEGFAEKGTLFTYAIGRLALWSPKPGLGVEDGQILRGGAFTHLAIASPKAAPYGLAASQVMEKLGVWEPVQPRLVQGENLAQTFQFVESGAADLGFVALSQLIETGKRREGSLWEVPKELHAPIEQRGVMLKSTRDPAAARAFLRFLRSEKARKIITEAGYILPAPEKTE